MHNEFWEAIKHRFQTGRGSTSGLEMSLNSLVRHIQVRYEAVKDAISLPPNGVFLFAIDEARSMLDVHSPRAANSLFFKWTRAISYLQNMNIFFVLLDTTSKLSSFQPSIFLDPSIRIQTGSLLFHPFYFYPFTGPWPLDDSKEVLTIASDRPASIANVLYDVLLPAKFSRPEFFRIAKSNRSAPFQCYESMLSFAVVKLLNQIEAKGKGRSMSAVLSSKFALVPLEYEDAEDLVSSHCGTLLYVSPNRASIVVKYIPEPMLAEGASFILWEEDSYNNHLLHLQKLIMSGKVAPVAKKGDLGEFLASVFLLRAKDREVIRQCVELNIPVNNTCFQSFCYPIKVKHFLRMLFVDVSMDLGDLGEGLVNFNSYQKIDSPITHNIIADAFRKCYALFPREDETAFDFFIPVLLPLASKCSTRKDLNWNKFETLASNSRLFSCIAIQVKNWSSTIAKNKAVELNENQKNYVRSDLKLENPIVAIVMAVGKGITGISSKLNKCADNSINGFISGFPSIAGSVSEASIQILHEILNFKGIPSLFASQMTRVFSLAYKDKEFTQEMEQFSQYVSASSASFQPDGYGIQGEDVRKVIAATRTQTKIPHRVRANREDFAGHLAELSLQEEKPHPTMPLVVVPSSSPRIEPQLRIGPAEEEEEDEDEDEVVATGLDKGAGTIVQRMEATTSYATRSQQLRQKSDSGRGGGLKSQGGGSGGEQGTVKGPGRRIDKVGGGQEQFTSGRGAGRGKETEKRRAPSKQHKSSGRWNA